MRVDIHHPLGTVNVEALILLLIHRMGDAVVLGDILLGDVETVEGHAGVTGERVGNVARTAAISFPGLPERDDVTRYVGCVQGHTGKQTR